MRIWMRRGSVAWLLWPLSLLFRMLVALRRALYRLGALKSVQLPVPVIVVGNIFIGGTGKTPLTIWLVQALRRAGFSPGVVSRGYGGKESVTHPVTATSDPKKIGDEPLLIAMNANCPVMVGRDRVAAAKALLADHPEVDVIVSDDGLQHYALARDVEIVLFDSRGAGNGWMLPAGPLREPVSRRRDFTVINGDALPVPDAPIRAENMHLMRLTGDHAEQLCDRSRRMRLTQIPETTGQARVAAAAGIGNPARFFAMLRLAGLRFSEMPLPDHFEFSAGTFATLDADIILITEKDAVKCARIDALASDARIWIVPVETQIDAEMERNIVEKCREPRPA